MFVDRVLPFGLRSAPLLFSFIVDALLYIMLNNEVSWAIHYLDDFLTMGPAESPECAVNMQHMQAICREAGLPLEPNKTIGPASTLTFLGIELDSVALQIRLPADKLADVQASLRRWRVKLSCIKTELLSLIGTLSHAAR